MRHTDTQNSIFSHPYLKQNLLRIFSRFETNRTILLPGIFYPQFPEPSECKLTMPPAWYCKPEQKKNG